MLSVTFKRPQRRCCERHLVNKQGNKMTIGEKATMQMFLAALHCAKTLGLGCESSKSFQVSRASRLAWKITNEMLCDVSIVLLDNDGNKWRVNGDFWWIIQSLRFSHETKISEISNVSLLEFQISEVSYSCAQIFTTIKKQTLQLKFDTVIYKIEITENST